MTHSFTRAIWLIVLVSAPVFGQSDPGNLTVISFPPGTAITLEGEYRLAGVTPVTFNQKLHGVYKLEAVREGYEKYETKLVLTGDDPFQIDFELAPKTRAKAGFRSMVLPGWGQIYSGQKTRGALYTGATILSLVSLVVTDHDFREKRDDYEAVLELYDLERNIEKKRELKARLDDVQDRAYDAETVRQVAIGVVGFIWAFNVIDAVVFFPDRRYSVGGPASISLDTGTDFDRMGLKFAISF